MTKGGQVSVSFPVNVTPNSLAVVTHRWMLRKVAVPYHGLVVLDAALNANIAAPNGTSVALLSQVIPDPSKRTFEFSGEISDTNLFDTGFTNIQTPVTDQDCKTQGQTVHYEPFYDAGD